MVNVLSFAGWSTAGAALIWGLIAIYFSLHRALGDLIYNVFTHNLEYISAIPWSVRLRYCMSTLATLSRTQALVWMLSVAGLVALLGTGRKTVFLFLAGWTATSMLGVSASGYFFPHYFQQMIPVLSVTTALGAKALHDARFWGMLPYWRRKTVLAILLAALPVIGIYPFLFVYSPAEAADRIYPGNALPQMLELGTRIAQITSPEDRVFVFGAEPELLFYAQRVSATRYIFLFPLYGPYRDAREKQVATANEILQNRPAAVAYLPNRLFFVAGTEQFFTKWCQSFIRENYRAEVYLTVDQAGAFRIVPDTGHGETALPRGERSLGAVYVRKDG